MTLNALDHAIIGTLRRWSEPLARLAIFIVFFWFGMLKVIAASPASPLVAALLQRTIPFLPFSTFIILFGLYEMLIGVLFLIKGAERLAILLLILHLFATILPLFLLRSVTWSNFMVPTLEGQYIIKNIVIIALAVGIGAHLHPLKK